VTISDDIAGPSGGSIVDGASETLTPSGQPLFEVGQESRSRIIGLVCVVALLISGAVTFFILVGLTPISPSNQIVTAAAIVNGVLAAVLIFLIGREVYAIFRSRRKGRAASRLHVRIIGLFCLVAAFPAILVAIVAGITLDQGLDRWFEIRTKRIIESSVSVARAYMNESTRVLMGNTLSMAANLDRNRQLYVLDRRGFTNLFTIESRGRGFIGAALYDAEGKLVLKANLVAKQELPPIPPSAIISANQGNPVQIPPGSTNFVGAVFKLREIPDAYLYSIIAVQPSVLIALRETRINAADYRGLEQNRLPFQIAFAILYLGVCLIVLLAAIWMGISVANRNPPADFCCKRGKCRQFEYKRRFTQIRGRPAVPERYVQYYGFRSALATHRTGERQRTYGSARTVYRSGSFWCECRRNRCRCQGPHHHRKPLRIASTRTGRGRDHRQADPGKKIPRTECRLSTGLKGRQAAIS